MFPAEGRERAKPQHHFYASGNCKWFSMVRVCGRRRAGAEMRSMGIRLSGPCRVCKGVCEFPPCRQREPLKDFKQGHDLIRFVF